MNSFNFDNFYKYSSYFLLPLILYFAFNSIFASSVYSIDEDVPKISFSNYSINEEFGLLFSNQANVVIVEDTTSLFEDLKIELVGIISVNEDPSKGYIILNFKDEKIDKKIYRPGDKIVDDVFLEAIENDYMQIRIKNEVNRIYLTKRNNVTNVNGVIVLDVSLFEILPYLKINNGDINGTQGVYISDTVDGKIIKKLHLKKTDLLFNLSGYNVFNLATLNDAYNRLQGQKDIIASIFRDGKIKKLVVRRLND